METVVTVINQTVTSLPAWIAAALGVVGAASAVTALTPTPRDDRWIGRIYKAIEILALHVGHARELPPNRR